MKKNIFRFLIFFLCNMVLFLYSEQLYAEDFCSDIKVPMIKDGDFDRCEVVENCNESSANQCCQEKLWSKINGQWNKGNKAILKFKVTINTTENENCVEGTQRVDYLNNTDSANATQKTSQIIITKKDNKNCTTITKIPVIFEADDIVVFDVTSPDGKKTIKKAPKPAIFKVPLKKDRSCKLKSCLDLTLEEFEAINYSKNFVSDSDGKFVFPPEKNCTGDSNDPSGCKDEDGLLFYKFCEPYKHNEESKEGEKIEIEKDNNGNIKNEPLYCHDFPEDKEDVLQYLWQYGTAYDGSGNYHCVLHQCPINEGLTLSCKTNYLNFADKDENYLKNYLKYIVGIKIVDTKEVDQLNKQELLRALNTAKCTSLDYNDKDKDCLSARFSMLEKYQSEEDAEQYCDQYIGLDKNLYKSNRGPLSSEDQKKIRNIFQLSAENQPIAEECDENGEICYTCIKTYDCALTTLDNYETICSNAEGNQKSEPDSQLSYFYRPVPPSPATEICPSKDKTNCAGMEGRTVIRRTLRGKVDYPLTDNDEVESKLGSSYWTYQKDGDRPIPVQDYFREKELCASSADDFKNFESEIFNIWFLGIKTPYNYGKYYDGFWQVTKAGQLPHILPLCKASRLGVYGSGREYTCENGSKEVKGNVCHTPSWDSYYIKGVPTYVWKDSDAHIQTVKLEACLRQKNTGELDVCGERECRVDCAFGECLYQWCGIDRCVTLITEVGKACPVIPNSSELDNANFMKNYQNCAKEVSNSAVGGSSIRFRLQALDRNVYVFLDMTSLGCDDLNTTRRRGDTVEDDEYTHNEPTNFVSYNNPKSDNNTIGGTFIDGILDRYELYDDNSLTDNNCDGVINDQDIFGEYLYNHWNCKALTKYETETNATKPDGIPANEWCDKDRTENEYNLNCQAMRITGSDSVGSLLEGKYIPIDVVQYRGNNQNIDISDINKKIKDINKTNLRNFCKIGQLDRCRGYFDKDDNFIREQQAVILPIPVVPNFFYKHATYDNIPDLFLPILSIYKAQRADNDIYVPLDLINDENPLFLKFFEPSIGIQYGGDDEFENTRYEFCTKGSNCTCLYKKAGCDCSKDYCAKPISQNELNSKIVTIPFQNTNILGKVKKKYGKNNAKEAETFYVFKKTAYLDPEPAARVCLYQVLINDKERLVRCLNRANPLISDFFIKPDIVKPDMNKIKKPTVKAYFHNLSKQNLISGTKINLDNSKSIIKFYNNNNTSHKEEDQDDKLIESSYAYGQGYPIFLQRTDCSKLYYDCIFYKNEYKEKFNDPAIKKEELSDLQGQINYCDLIIDLKCRNQNGNENLVLKTTKNNGNITTELIKVKENPNAIGGYNQMCVTKGFEKDKTYQLIESMPMKDNILGKCILTKNSKKNANCRKKFYYEYCDTVGDGCVCLNGDSTCNCGNNSCVKQIDCSCSSEEACISLPEGCYVSGFNSNHSVLNGNDELIDVCECQKARTNTNNATRQPTPRELGLCVDLIDINFCEAVKYYDENRNYIQGGDGKVLGVIETDHYSNIWRTTQKQLGKTYMGDFEHAEFDKANDCSGLPDAFCNLTEVCYYNSSSSLKGRLCEKGAPNCECAKVQTGTCNGFWKYKYNTVPLAKCGPKMKNNTEIFTDDNGDAYYIYELIPNTGCERYSCPTIIDEEAITKKEEEESEEATETSIDTVNTKGKSNGFATWAKYKKGTYAVLDNQEENEHGDDIEQREAEHCLQGYGPAGSNFAIKNYIPLSRINSGNIINTGSITDIDNIVKNMLGYNLYVNNQTSTINTKQYTSDVNISVNDDQKLRNYNIFATATGYFAKEHLPVRYCSQLGNWMPVDDIYNKYGIVPYYTTNEVFHKPNLTNNGFINNTTINTHHISTSEENTYKNNINYSERYCERLTCQAINEDDIGLLSVENSIPQNKLQYENLQNINYNIAYPNTTENNNYPKIAKNPDDTRTNSVYNNRYTFWRHAGGATWSETPTPRESDTTDVITGTCYEKGGFYPYDTKFLYDEEEHSSFDRQYESLFSPNGSNQTANLKTNSLKASTSPSTQPKRTCSKWGIWSNIGNECVATCEPLDPFRTGFKDENRYEKSDGSIESKPDGLLQNYEITELYRDPKYRSNYFRLVGNVKYGDIYTGGAKWGRTKAGEVAIGECDARVGKTEINSAEYLKRKQNGFPDELNKSGIQFLRTGNSSLKSLNIIGYRGETITHNNINTKGRPYRACLPDGTWGPVQDACVNFRTCTDNLITTESLLKSGQFQTKNDKEDIQNIATLSGGSINYEYANSNSGIFEIPLEVNCNSNMSFASGTIKKTCNVTTGEWVENLTTTNCSLKTCAGGQYNLTYNNSFTINNGEYYPKTSGYKGAITINKSGNSKSYLGYEFLKTCPTGYTCNGCDTNNGEVNYTCDFDNNNNLNWIKTGTCEPKTCNLTNLQNLCDGKTGCNKPSSLTLKTKSSIALYDNGDSISGSNATVGTEVSLSCKSGYSGDISATCNIDGTWAYNGTCQEVKCPSFNEAIDNGVYVLAQNGTCVDGTLANNCLGAKYSLSCNSGYTKDSNKTWTCGNDGNWKEEGNGWCGKDCNANDIKITICDYNKNCNISYDPSGTCYTNNIQTFYFNSYTINHGKTENVSMGEKTIVLSGGCSDDTISIKNAQYYCNNGTLERKNKGTASSNRTDEDCNNPAWVYTHCTKSCENNSSGNPKSCN